MEDNNDILGEEVKEIRPAEKKAEVHAEKESEFIKKMKQNPWMVSTFVFAIASLILLALYFYSPNGLTGNVISDQSAVQDTIELVSRVYGVDLEYTSVVEEDDIYNMAFTLDGSPVELSVTKDFEFLKLPSGGWIRTADYDNVDNTAENPSAQNTQTSVPKSDKPVVEMFIMSHCPYGTQAEKGIIPVAELLGNKIDFTVRYVYYAMHPSQGEVEEQLNQYCIREEQNAKFISYLKCFLDKGDGASCLTTTGIDKTKMNACVQKADAEFEVSKNLNDKSLWLSGSFPLFNVDKDLNDEYGIGGSPTLVINGVQASPSSRAPSSYLASICNAFNTAPEECSEVVSSEAPSPGFGWSGTSASGSDATCG
ncbi:MAG: hypothetical protein ABIH72_05220 [archaeon]